MSEQGPSPTDKMNPAEPPPHTAGRVVPHGEPMADVVTCWCNLCDFKATGTDGDYYSVALRVDVHQRIVHPSLFGRPS